MKIALRHPAIAITAALTVIVALLGMRATPANASGISECVQAVSYNQCLNDWNNGGLGATIRLDPIGDSNENFIEQNVPGRCGGHVTSNCPFSNTYFDNQYFSWPIVQLKYGTTNHCVATSSPGNTAVLGTCNNTTSGNGGSNGTLFVDHNGFMINIYWTNKNQYGNNAACMEPEGGSGSSSFVYLDLPTGDGCAAWVQA